MKTSLIAAIALFSVTSSLASLAWAEESQTLVCDEMQGAFYGHEVVVERLSGGAYNLQLFEMTPAGPVPLDSRRVTRYARMDRVLFQGHRVQLIVTQTYGGALNGSIDMMIPGSAGDSRFLSNRMLCRY